MSDTLANQRATQWLADLARALTARDVSAVLALFDEPCFWRDMVAFTWNLKTMEGKDEIAAMLDATLSHVRPGSFAIKGEAREAEGVTEARFTFETSVARGSGHLRRKGDKGWTILTAAGELKGHEEKAGRARDMGVAHGVHTDRKTWLERKTEEEAALGFTRPALLRRDRRRPGRHCARRAPEAAGRAHRARPIKPTSTRCHSARQPNPGRGST